MTAMTARPTAVPNWAMVLKTAPARAWVVGGKEEVMMRAEMMKRTASGRVLIRLMN